MKQVVKRNGFYMHYGEGACNIAMDVKDFYAENIKGPRNVRCQFIEFREGVR